MPLITAYQPRFIRAKPTSPPLGLNDNPRNRGMLLFLPLIGASLHPSEAYGKWARLLRGPDPWTDVTSGGSTIDFRGSRGACRRIQNTIDEGFSTPTMPLGDVGTGDFSIVWSAYVRLMGAAAGFRGAFGFGSFNPGFYWKSNAGNMAVFDGSWKETGTGQPSDNAWITVGLSRQGGTLSAYIDGRPSGTTATWSDALVNGVFNFGIQGSGFVTPDDVSYEYVAMAERAWTPEEHLEWHQEPYEIFQSDADWIHSVFVPEASGGQSVVVGVATETDTAQAVTPTPGAVSVAVGAATETDTASSVTPIQGIQVAVGVATETDTAASVTPVAGATSIVVGGASETDTASTVTPSPGAVSVAVGTASETDTASSVTANNGISVAVGTASETDTAASVTPVPGATSIAIGVASETDVASAVGVLQATDQSIVVGVASEVDTAGVVAVGGGLPSALSDNTIHVMAESRASHVMSEDRETRVMAQ